MRTWSEDNPKAPLMARKRDLILEAALSAFLAEGYAGSSVNRIAAEAGVSIKTLYRHFEDKDDLFVSVIQAACETTDDDAEPAWFARTPPQGLVDCGREHLRHVTSPDQLALYRVVAKESQRFPQLGRRYQRDVQGYRIDRFTRYLDRWPAELRERITDPARAALVFSGLLCTDAVENALLGGPALSEEEIAGRAKCATEDFLALVGAKRL